MTQCVLRGKVAILFPVLFLAALLAYTLHPLAPRTAEAAEQLPSSPNHRGISRYDPYLVFPENRQGNGVYFNNKLVLEAREKSIVDVLPLSVEGRFIYYARDVEGNGTLGAHVKPADRPPRVRAVASGFYHVVLVLNGVVFKKLYRIVDSSILDLLPNSKTADGAIAGPGGVVFYHVASATREENDGQTGSTFGLRLHLALFDEERSRHLDYMITNALPRLTMGWLDDTRIEIGLADGRTEILSVSQFQ